MDAFVEWWRVWGYITSAAFIWMALLVYIRVLWQMKKLLELWTKIHGNLVELEKNIGRREEVMAALASDIVEEHRRLQMLQNPTRPSGDGESGPMTPH